MQFAKNPTVPVLSCAKCKSTGFVGFTTCRECRGMSIGAMSEGIFLYFGKPLTRYQIRVRKMRRVLNIFHIVGAIVFGFGFLALFFLYAERNAWWGELFSLDFWFNRVHPQTTLLWFSVLSWCYLWYRVLVTSEPPHEITYDRTSGGNRQEISQPQSWIDVRKMKRKNRFDIVATFSPQTQKALEDAYHVADKMGSETLMPLHLFYVLLESSEIASIFIRLGVSVKSLRARIAQYFEKNKGKTEPIISPDVQQIIFNAYAVAREFHDTHVRTTELLVSCVRQSEPLQELLYDLNIDAQKLTNVVEWVKIREQLYEQYVRFQRAASRMSKYGMDRAMTAVATPYLNNFSTDLTLMAKYGHLAACVARDEEIEEVFRIVEGGRQNIILVGEHGVGKMSIVEGVVQRMIAGDAPQRLLDKRFVQISPSSLMAGATVSGAQERLIRIMNEVAKAGNIILFIHNLHELMGGSDGQNEGLDVSGALAEQLSSGRFLMFATATTDAFNRHIVSSQIGTLFTKVDVKKMVQNQAIQVLESKVGSVEYKQNIFFSYDALEKCVKLAMQFLVDQNLPDSALSLMAEVASYARSTHGENSLVTAEDVAYVISQKTGIPATSITEDESKKLMRLEDEMHKRVIGQDAAVELVANALRRARAEIRSQSRPIANFLFLGPTGTGKTELAKTIAEIYFGGENKMVRIDMSEYQDKTSIYRLIGQPGQQGTGVLTEAVRHNPFSLVLLDEMEKADPNVLNLFLQVFDDGRLTDSVGRLIDFTNTIIIATSNAGTSFVQEQLNQGIALDQIREQLIRTELKQYYRPEFLNRFDGIVLFKPLGREQVKQIASLMLKRVAKDLAVRGVELRVEDAALESLIEIGFDPEFGARPMRRAIQENVENKLAELVLTGKLNRRDVLVLGEKGEMRVERN